MRYNHLVSPNVYEKNIFGIKKLILAQVFFSALCTLMLATIHHLAMLLFDYDFSEGMRGIFVMVFAFAVCIVLDSVFQYISQKFEWKTCRAFKVMIKRDLFRVATKNTLNRIQKTQR